MQFVKTHLISLLAGVVGLAAIAVAALGMMSDSVAEEMKKHTQAANEVDSLKASAQNQATIDAEKARGEEFKREYKKTVEEAEKINKREPLLKGVFPKPETAATPLDFKNAYKVAMRQLPIKLNSGDLPNEAEIQDEVQNVIELQQAEKEIIIEGGKTERSISEQVAAPPQPTFQQPSIRGGNPRFTGAEEAEGPMGPGRNMRGYGEQSAAYVPSGEPKYDPKFRAFVTKAKSIFCYADPLHSFHISPVAAQAVVPQAKDMWFAQVGLWVQEDVVNAIAELNKEAAAQVKDGEPSVENVPVKRIETLRVQGYQLKGGLYAFQLMSGDSAGGGGSGEAARPTTFTGQTSNERFDVVRFALTAIIDQRDLLKVIDRICKQNFYKCIELKYELVTPENTPPGYMYGSAPCVRATLQFEGYMAREVFQPLMPPEVLKQLGGKQEP